jgi:hypothetical protein
MVNIDPQKYLSWHSVFHPGFVLLKIGLTSDTNCRDQYVIKAFALQDTWPNG